MLQIIKNVKTQTENYTTPNDDQKYGQKHLQFLYHQDSDTRKITRRHGKIKLKIINSVLSSLTKLAFVGILS